MVQLPSFDQLFAHGGETGRHLRSLDWSQTSLGPIENWSPSLKTAISLLLNAPYPMLIIWGIDQIQFHNDACHPFLKNTKNLPTFGQRASECWSTIWKQINPQIKFVLATSQATQQANIFWSNGCSEVFCLNWFLSPILETTGAVGGVFVTISQSSQSDSQLATHQPIANFLTAQSDRSYLGSLDSNQFVVNDILERITDAFVALDAQWRFTYVNQEAARLLQRSQQELVGKILWEDVFVEIAGTTTSKELRRAMADQMPLTLEEFSSVLNCHLEINAYPSPHGITIYFRDISDRIRVEEALQASEERFRFAARAVVGIVYDWNIATEEVYRSEGLEQLIGLKPEDAPQHREWWVERIHPEDQIYLYAIMEQILNGEADRYSLEYRVRHEDGRWVNVWDRGYLIRDKARKLTRVVGFTADITERKQAENERERLLTRERAAREEAETANRLKDEFLAVLSHELRTPLNPILGWSQLLQKRKYDDKTFIQALNTIERNAKLQVQLIDDLLDVSRILQAKLSLTMTAVDLVSVIQAAIETVRLAAEAKSINLRLELDERFHPSNLKSQPKFLVLGDPGRLQQVMWNLLSNAVKFTSEGGWVEVRLERVEDKRVDEWMSERVDETLPTHFLRHPPVHPYAQITVTDTGKGIDPEFLPYVFDYFRQEDGTTTRKFGGLGLGLAIVRYLTEMHGGNVFVSSPGKGEGATFAVRLPLLKDQDKYKHPVSEECVSAVPIDAHRLRGTHILLVDDGADVREFFSFLIKQAGGVVTAVSSASEALVVLNHIQPDLLISDIAMPNTDGYMFIQHVRSQLLGNRQIPAIALTAYAGEQDKQQALSAGFNLHCSKPVEPDEFIEAIVNLLKTSSSTC
ncbi:MAG: PAS domain-containing protein [Oscillatoriales cyanobacterium C42_A2020_001]|nr:PAS domain-containing protein [Leptolyngbyaceae cyanobacterium C42_A2020_001]